MEWLDVGTNYVSWWDDRKQLNNPQKSLLLTLKPVPAVTFFASRQNKEYLFGNKG